MRIDRQAFYEPESVFESVRSKVEKMARAGESIDYLTFVPDGEPTLDIHLGREIDLLRPLGAKIAVITNSSLLWRDDVVHDLKKADLISVKVDAVMEAPWRKLNRPHSKLKLQSILDGLVDLADSYKGKLITETMLVKGINDDSDFMDGVSQVLAQIRPAVAYLSIPTRPPAEAWVRRPDERTINRAYQTLRAKLDRVEYLLGYEGNSFAFSGNVKEDLPAITAVHPMTEEAVQAFLAKANSDWSLVKELLDKELLIETLYDGKRFYMRRLPKRRHK
jgi:wyosine [tRNA(Phe)-imidazoG37] synthetase (radical SAM superfamily)